jgi:hypothetical protein
MDEENELPKATLRDMGVLVIAVFDIARDAAGRVVERLRPFLRPPDDLRVHSGVGAVYSGVLIVERNVIVAAFAVEVGRVSREPMVTPPPHRDERRFEHYERPRSPFSGITDHFGRNDGRLPGWADDPRDQRDEDEPWRHR